MSEHAFANLNIILEDISNISGPFEVRLIYRARAEDAENQTPPCVYLNCTVSSLSVSGSV